MKSHSIYEKAQGKKWKNSSSLMKNSRNPENTQLSVNSFTPFAWTVVKQKAWNHFIGFTKAPTLITTLSKVFSVRIFHSFRKGFQSYLEYVEILAFIDDYSVFLRVSCDQHLDDKMGQILSQGDILAFSIYGTYFF